MSENTPNLNVREIKIQIESSQRYLVTGTPTKYGVLTRDVNISDQEIWVRDNRMTPEQFMQRFDFYANLDTSGHTRFYPITTEIGYPGIKQLISEISDYGLTKCESEVRNLLSEQQQFARDGRIPDSLVDLKQKLQSMICTRPSEE